ncbi:MAG: hypothetical protein ACJAS4_002839 [Bacteriovoracaceae bacterium]|jgi:hypothetical protein
MKKLIANLSLFLSIGAAQANSVYDYKHVVIAEHAFAMTVEMQNSRHENVEIDVLVMGSEELVDTLSSVQSTALNKLTNDELNSIKSCISERFCDVFILDITGSYHSGWSQIYKYYLVDDNMQVEQIDQTIQAE